MKNIVLSLFASLTFLFSLNATAIELNFAQGGGSQGQMTMELTAEWEKKTGHKVNFLEMPQVLLINMYNIKLGYQHKIVMLIYIKLIMYGLESLEHS